MQFALDWKQVENGFYVSECGPYGPDFIMENPDDPSEEIFMSSRVKDLVVDYVTETTMLKYLMRRYLQRIEVTNVAEATEHEGLVELLNAALE